ncbi:hypothetical protein ACBI99_15100 [Nonomuraea sp. ATR24]|uniref:hypothetical protein n=1 Tax=Nonomuraea sp. ATR24 TaxID=1676744 RepID=UPI0035C05700
MVLGAQLDVPHGDSASRPERITRRVPGVNDAAAIGIPSGTPPKTFAVTPHDQAHPDRNQCQPVTVVNVGVDAASLQSVAECFR